MPAAEQAFLEELRSDTESDDTREVYADWLEEQGLPERAEYLRLEAEVRRFDFITGSPEREAKKLRHDELSAWLAKNSLDWLLRVRRKPRPPVRLPRPTDLGVAELIVPARPEEPRVRIAGAEADVRVADLQAFAVRAPLDPLPLPPAEPSQPTAWRPPVLLSILVGIGLLLLIKDMTTKGFLMRVLERIYVTGRF